VHICACVHDVGPVQVWDQSEIYRMLSHTLTDNLMHQVVPTGTTDNSQHSGQDDNIAV